MSLTITSFTNKILEEHPKIEDICIYVDNATHNIKYDTWTADILEAWIANDHGASILDFEEYYELFGTKTRIKLGKNNKSRLIDSKNVFRIDINIKLNTFTTNDGKTINYYPSSSEIITDKDHIKQLRRDAITYYHNLIKLSKTKHQMPNLVNIPDIDSD